MLIRTKGFFKGRFSQLCIVSVMIFGFIFGYTESLFPAQIVGNAIETPYLKTNSINFQNPIGSSTNNYSLFFYQGYLCLSSVNNELFGSSSVQKNIFAINWETGNFLINNNLTVGGNTTAAGYSCSSDIRFKYNITPYTSAIEKIMSLNPISYYWNADKFKDRSFSKDRQIGFIAQDVEKVIPELVKTDEQGYKSMDYSKLSVVLVEAFKEQKKQSDTKISALEKENAGLKQRLASLEKMSERIAKLESMLKQHKAVLAAR